MVRHHVNTYIASFMLLGILDAAMNPGSIFGLQLSDRPTASVTATELSEAELLGLESKGEDELFGYNFDFDFDLPGAVRASSGQEYVPELLGYVPLPSVSQPAIGGPRSDTHIQTPRKTWWSWGGDSATDGGTSSGNSNTNSTNNGNGHGNGNSGGNNQGGGNNVGTTPEPTSAPQPTPAPTSVPAPEPTSEPKPEPTPEPIMTIKPPAPPLTQPPAPTVEPEPGNNGGGKEETVITPGYPGEVVLLGVKI